MNFNSQAIEGLNKFSNPLKFSKMYRCMQISYGKCDKFSILCCCYKQIQCYVHDFYHDGMLKYLVTLKQNSVGWVPEHFIFKM